MSQVCFKFQTGECTRGDECRFAHVIDPNAVPPPRREGGDFGNRGPRGAPGVCYAFQRGECERGSACRFSHNLNGDRDNSGGGRFNGARSGGSAPGVCFAFQRGECERGSACRFSHSTDRTERDWRDRSDGDRGSRPQRSSQVCYKFQKGECTRGDSCRFSHEIAGEN